MPLVSHNSDNILLKVEPSLHQMTSLSLMT